jgi:hypothetical protein
MNLSTGVIPAQAGTQATYQLDCERSIHTRAPQGALQRAAG